MGSNKIRGFLNPFETIVALLSVVTKNESALCKMSKELEQEKAAYQNLKLAKDDLHFLLLEEVAKTHRLEKTISDLKTFYRGEILDLEKTICNLQTTAKHQEEYRD